MALIIGLSALFVALLSLWMVGESSHRKNMNSDIVFKNHVTWIKSQVEEITVSLEKSNRVVNELTMRLDLLEADNKVQNTDRTATKKTLAVMEKHTRLRKDAVSKTTSPKTQQAGKRGAA